MNVNYNYNGNEAETNEMWVFIKPVTVTGFLAMFV